MTQDAYVQVATDGSGKKVGMEQAADVFGNTIYLQRALLVGDPADAIAQILETDRQILTCLRALLRVMTETSNSRVQEEDFTPAKGASFDG